MINIPKQLWYVGHTVGDNDLAYMTYYEDNAAFEKRKLAFTNKSTNEEDFSYDYHVPDDNLYPRELKEFRREVE